ncbi:MAG: AMP-binding protein [Methylococcaceae bacterium]|nr:AMP-binding protein [Methylococcaceae bacterium]MCI0733589.1 AMP-binding protein [Methylococcaceae bacterium]
MINKPPKACPEFKQSRDKPWITQYPEGTPAEVGPVPWSSIPDFFASIVRKYPDHPAVANMGTQLSYTQLDEISSQLANYLAQEIGLPKGSRVAIMMPNLLQHAVAILGILKAGLIVVNINPLYTPDELQHQLSDSGAKAIIILENFCHVLESVLQVTAVEHVIRTSIGDLLTFPRSLVVNFVVKHVKKMVPDSRIRESMPFKWALAKGSRISFRPPEIDPDDTAVLQYTGGTTGVCKGAVLSHRNLLINMQQSTLWISRGAVPGKQIVPGREIVINALPLYHIFSLTASFLTFINLGSLNYLITNPRDLPTFIKELKRVPFTCIPGVNTLFNRLMTTPGFKDLDFSTLKLSVGGGMAIQRSVAERWKALTGCSLIEGYGLTEASPAVCLNPLNLQNYNGSIGLPLPSTECSIRDDEGFELPSGEIGELWVRGPQVMQGYWNRPDETEKVLSPDGWLKTGDIARIDDGYIHLVDRKKDMIIVSGFNVFPNDIEVVICNHPDAVECGVIGIEDDDCGEAIRAFVVSSNPELDEQQLILYCRERLTPYKVPKSIIFVPDLPKSDIGKVLRRKLRELMN